MTTRAPALCLAAGLAVALALSLSGSRAALAQRAGGPAAAGGAGNQAAAEKRFQEAEGLYRRGQYLAAAAEYQAAFDLSGLPGLLYNVAQSYRLGGEKEKAVASYRLFLERAPDHPLAKVARGHVEALERELAEARSKQPARAPGGGEAPARPDVVATSPPAPRRGRGLELAGLVTAGVGLVALGAALHYGIEARQASDAISDNQEGWSQSLLDRYDEGQTAETRMFVLSGVGAVALATGGVLYYLGWRAGRAESAVSVGAAGGPGAAALSFGGRF